MQEIISFMWNVTKAIGGICYFLIALIGMIVALMIIIKGLIGILERIFEHAYAQHEGFRSICLVFSIILGFTLLLFIVFILGKMIGNFVLLLFFLLGIYTIYHRYVKASREE